MVQQVEGKALLVSTDRKCSDWRWYRCNQCNDMFSYMVHFEEWDFYYCIPRRCPNCGIQFENGMEEI